MAGASASLMGPLGNSMHKRPFGLIHFMLEWDKRPVGLRIGRGG
jgi:hypothetical protein